MDSSSPLMTSTRLAKSSRSCHADPALRQWMGAQGRELIEREYTLVALSQAR